MTACTQVLSVHCLFFNNPQEVRGRHNCYVSEGMRCQKIIIAADDMGGAARDSQFQELVILRISACSNYLCCLHEKRSLNKGRKKFFPLGGCHISLKLRTLKHIG